MANKEDITTRFKVDISDLKKGITEANKNIKLANAEFKAASAGMDDWAKSSDGINAKLKQLNTVLDSQKAKLENYKKQQASLEDGFQENGKRAEELKAKLAELASQGVSKTSDEYKKYQKALTDVEKEQAANKNAIDGLRITILNQQAAVNKTEKEISDYESTLKNVQKAEEQSTKTGQSVVKCLNDIEKEAEKADSKLGGLAKSLGSGLKKGFAAIGTAAAGLVAGFLASGEASQEFVEDMGKLETAFTTSGHSVETAKKTYNDFVGILGETDQSVEAANHLAKLTDSQEELAQWSDIAAGVYATFGDSLPIEGLTEAANETAKVGQVTGPLADALNWAGISEDEFNAKLAACSSEQERATLITETLNGVYEEAGEKYQELNGDLIAARQVQSDFTAAMSEVGSVAMPINTMLKQFGTELLSSLVPGLQEAGEGLKGLANGSEGAAEQLRNGIQTAIDGLLSKLNEALPMILQVGIQIIMSLIQGIIQALPQVVQTVMNLIPQITQAILSLLPQLVTLGIQLIESILIGLGQMIPEIVTQIVEIIPQIVQALVDGIPALINGAVQFFMAIIEALPELIDALVSAIPQIIDTVVNGLITAIPQIIDGALQMLMAIIDAIPLIIEALIPQIPTIISTIVEGLINGLDAIIQGAIQLLMGIIKAIPEIIKALIPQIPNIVITIVKVLIENIPTLIEGAIQLFMALVEAIPTICLELIKAIPQIIVAIFEGLAELPGKLGEFFTGIWDGIKNIFSGVGDWFGEKFTQANENAKLAWDTAKEWAGNAWDNVKEGFSGVGSWFKENFDQANKNAKGAFDKAKEWAGGAWKKVKEGFSGVGDWFKEKFTDANKKAKGAFDGFGKFFSNLWDDIKETFSKLGTKIGDAIGGSVKSGINGVIGLIENAVNSAIGLINGAIGLINKIPGVNIGQMSKLRFPRLEQGGILKKGQVGLLEGDGAEAVIPLDQNKKWIRAQAKQMVTELKRQGGVPNATGAISNTYNFYQTNNSPKALSRLDIYRQSKNLLALRGG